MSSAFGNHYVTHEYKDSHNQQPTYPPSDEMRYDTVIAMYACADRRSAAECVRIGGLIVVAAQLCYGQLDGVSLNQ